MQQRERQRRIRRFFSLFVPFLVVVGGYLGMQAYDLYQLQNLQLSSMEVKKEAPAPALKKPVMEKAPKLSTAEFTVDELAENNSLEKAEQLKAKKPVRRKRRPKAEPKTQAQAKPVSLQPIAPKVVAIESVNPQRIIADMRVSQLPEPAVATKASSRKQKGLTTPTTETEVSQ
ncbi:MAG: hypothetical protein D6730_08105 [Bacteroidetes bacterium]|nr:MAG: hypothetical protein D6730_08105 [Bacteroidota bacterium]